MSLFEDGSHGPRPYTDLLTPLQQEFDDIVAPYVTPQPVESWTPDARELYGGSVVLPSTVEIVPVHGINFSSHDMYDIDEDQNYTVYKGRVIIASILGGVGLLHGVDEIYSLQVSSWEGFVLSHVQGGDIMHTDNEAIPYVAGIKKALALLET